MEIYEYIKKGDKLFRSNDENGLIEFEAAIEERIESLPTSEERLAWGSLLDWFGFAFYPGEEAPWNVDRIIADIEPLVPEIAVFAARERNGLEWSDDYARVEAHLSASRTSGSPVL